MVKAQSWLDKNYPKEERREITFLNIDKNKDKLIEGDMDLSDFVNLQEIFFFDADLVNTNFLKTIPNPEKLLYLDLRNNNFDQQDLSIFERFVNLEKLNLGNNDKNKIDQGVYNRFEGSLNPLKNMKGLEILDISNTDIDDDWWCLPNELKKINYSSKNRPSEKLKTIEEALEPYCEDWGVNIIEAKNNFWVTHGLKREEELKKEIISLKLKLTEVQKGLNNRTQELETKEQELTETQTNLKNKEEDIFLLSEKISKIFGTSVDLLNNWDEIDNEKKELNEKIIELTEELKNKEAELKKAKENNEKISRVEELEKEVERLKKQLDNEKEKLQKLEKKEKKITELARLKGELMWLKHDFLGKVDRMKNFNDRKTRVKNELEKFLKATSDLIYDNKNISAKKEKEESQNYLKIAGLQIDLDQLSGKQKKITNEEMRLELINLSYEFVDQELIDQWKSNFGYKETKEWVKALGSEFNSEDYKFVNWLISTKQESYANLEWVSENLAQLRSEYQDPQHQARQGFPTNN